MRPLHAAVCRSRRPIIEAAVVCFATSAARLARDETPASTFSGEHLTCRRDHETESWYVDQGDLVRESGLEEGCGYLASGVNAMQIHDDADATARSRNLRTRRVDK